VLREHASVTNACVIATTHPAAGTVLTGFVELQDGAVASVAELRAHLAGRRPIKWCRHASMRESLPLAPAARSIAGR
jgi:acyl-coenzyme A synthetase/AMP-(fatty) acid ligase